MTWKAIILIIIPTLGLPRPSVGIRLRNFAQTKSNSSGKTKSLALWTSSNTTWAVSAMPTHDLLLNLYYLVSLILLYIVCYSYCSDYHYRRYAGASSLSLTLSCSSISVILYLNIISCKWKGLYQYVHLLLFWRSRKVQVRLEIERGTNKLCFLFGTQQIKSTPSPLPSTDAWHAILECFLNILNLLQERGNSYLSSKRREKNRLLLSGCKAIVFLLT